MTEQLEGRSALVTGASSGIGEATARRLAQQGAAVAVAARRRDRLDTLAKEINAAGGRAVVIEADVTDEAQARGAVERTVEELGGLDIVVNNAGVMLNGATLEAPLEEWERMVSLNVLGLLYVSHAALPHLVTAAEINEAGVADLVNISSVAGRVTRPGVAVYNLTKHGVGAFSDSLRQEFAPKHVRVSLVEPGAVATELASHMRPEALAQMAQRFKGIEILVPEDIAEAIGFVVSRPRRMAVNEILIRPTEQEG